VTDRQKDLLEFYRRHRLNDQLTYYLGRVIEFEAAELQASWVAGLILVFASANALIAASGLVPPANLWKILAAVLPALAVSVTAFQRIYAFDRLAKLYQDAITALAVPIAMPAAVDDAAVEASIQALVSQTEEVFAREQGQWGQLVEQMPTQSPPRAESPKG
jgi:conflict system pore-forming effector with SLATT domain